LPFLCLKHEINEEFATVDGACSSLEEDDIGIFWKILSQIAS
jgi:hypothetical protein